MFTQIRIAGLGAHVDTTIQLSPTGRTVVLSPSRGGKSTMLYALCACLIATAPDGGAFDVDIMSADRLALEVRTPNRVFSYTRTRKGSQKWTHEEVCEHPFPRSATSAKEWIRILAEDLKLPLWKGSPERREAVRLAFVPMAWTELATSDQSTSRRLRDAIVATAGATPPEEAKRLFAVAGYELNEEVYHVKVAEKDVTEANRAHDVATGQALQAAAAVTALVAPVEPDTSAADDLPAMTAAAELWAAYDRAVAARQQAVQQANKDREAVWGRREEWRQACARLDQHHSAAVATAESVHRAAVAEWKREAASREERHAADVRSAAEQHAAAVQARADRMAARGVESRERYTAAVQAAEEDYQRDITGHTDRVAKLTAEREQVLQAHAANVMRLYAEHKAATAAWEERAAELQREHERALAAHLEAKLAAEKWDAAFSALPESMPPCPTCGHAPSRGEHLGARPLVGVEPVLVLPPSPVTATAGTPPAAPAMPSEPVRRTVPPYVAPAPEAEPVARTVAPLGPMRPEPVYTAPVPSPRPPEPVWTEPAALPDPVEPAVPRPLPRLHQAAKDAAAERERHKVRLEQHAQQVKNLHAGAEKAKAAQAAAKVAADRAAAWLKAVRDAPGEIAKRLEWCKEIGHGVRIELDPEKITNGAAVQVTVEGRSYKEPLTSKGQLVLVDALIRDKLAKALGFVNKAGVRTFPIVVDNRHLWSGELPIDGPVIELITDQPEWVTTVDGKGSWLEYPVGPLRSEIS